MTKLGKLMRWLKLWWGRVTGRCAVEEVKSDVVQRQPLPSNDTLRMRIIELHPGLVSVEILDENHRLLRCIQGTHVVEPPPLVHLFLGHEEVRVYEGGALKAHLRGVVIERRPLRG